jgi:hypothetical protein
MTNLRLFFSYYRKANTVLRAKIDTSFVSVIPNAVDTAVFRPAGDGDVRPKPNRSE